MRKIKFRGKRIGDNKWVEGCFCKAKKYTDHLEDNERAYILQVIDRRENGINAIEIEVDPATVGQYVGLKDSKRTKEYPEGQEIYEGDIVECVYDGVLNTHVAIYDISELGFKATNGKENYGGNFEYLPCCEEVIVIGNVHDNPELAKEV